MLRARGAARGSGGAVLNADTVARWYAAWGGPVAFAWEEARQLSPVVTVEEDCAGVKHLGYVRHGSWTIHGGGGAAPTVRRPALVLSGEALRDPRLAVCVAVHELCHLVALARGVADTSNRGRYHNATFRALAESLGGVWPSGKPDRLHGWSFVEFAPPVEAVKLCAADIAELGYRAPPPPAAARRRKLAVLKCRCQRLAVAPRCELRSVVCGECGAPLALHVWWADACEPVYFASGFDATDEAGE